MVIPEPVSYLVENRVAILTLDRLERLNAINDDMKAAIVSNLRRAEEDAVVNVILLKGAGRAFSSGADLLGEDSEATAEMWLERLAKSSGMLSKLTTCNKPTIAAVRGYALGMGFWLMSACDMCVVSETAKLGTPEIHQGASSISFLNPNLSRNRAFELYLTGGLIDGREAQRLGLANKVVPDDMVELEAMKLARKVALLPLEVVKLTKSALSHFYEDTRLQDYLSFSSKVVAIIHSGSHMKKWNDFAKTHTLKEFLRARDGPFQEIDDGT